MNTLELLSKYLSSPIVGDRQKSINVLVEEILKDPNGLVQLERNLDSKNLDIVTSTLKVILAISLRNNSQVVTLLGKVFSLGKKSKNFDVVFMCKEIFASLNSKESNILYLEKRITPKFKEPEENEDYFYGNCDYSLEYKLGSKDNKYEISHLCRIFRQDCEKAFEMVKTYMVELGYDEVKHSRKERPYRWRNDYEGHDYESGIHYYARHALKMFLMWCIQNLPIPQETWEGFLLDEKKWDPSIPELLEERKPPHLVFKEMNLDTETWFKKRIKKQEGYEFLNPHNGWITLNESTNFETNDKDFDRYMTTCFVDRSFGNDLKKVGGSLPRYKTRDALINDLPILAKQKGMLHVEDYSHETPQGLIPSYGVTDGSLGEYLKIFPAPEIVEYLKLKQKKNTLEYYKGKELVAKCVNWRSGYRKNRNGYGDNRFEVSNYGYHFVIKAKYLKKYMEENKLKLIAMSTIWKRKQKRYESSYDSKDSKYKWIPVEKLKF